VKKSASLVILRACDFFGVACVQGFTGGAYIVLHVCATHEIRKKSQALRITWSVFYTFGEDDLQCSVLGCCRDYLK
jgi:hypothetical protein